MFVGMLALAGSTVTGMATMQTNRESAQALQAARRCIECMQTGEVPFEDLFVAYAREPVAPAEGEGEAQAEGPEAKKKVPYGLLKKLEQGELKPVLSRKFGVTDLKLRDGDPDGALGELVFPVAEGAEGPELREDIAKRDLNADGVIDSEDHSNDYVILPVTVRIEWKGGRGTRQIELHSLLVRR